MWLALFVTFVAVLLGLLVGGWLYLFNQNRMLNDQVDAMKQENKSKLEDATEAVQLAYMDGRREAIRDLTHSSLN